MNYEEKERKRDELWRKGKKERGIIKRRKERNSEGKINYEGKEILKRKKEWKKERWIKKQKKERWIIKWNKESGINYAENKK